MRSIPYTWDTLNFENLSKNKINWMVSNRFLTLTPNNYNLLKEHFKGKHIDLLKRYPNEFIENQIDYSLDEDDVLALLDFSEFSQQQKISIIQNTNNKLIINNKELSNSICNILSACQYIELDFTVLQSLIQHGRSEENKLKLFNLQFDLLSHEQITKLLNTLGEPYSDIAIKGRRPSLPKDQINFDLVCKLKEKDYISSFKEKKDTIKVYTKNH